MRGHALPGGEGPAVATTAPAASSDDRLRRLGGLRRPPSDEALARLPGLAARSLADAKEAAARLARTHYENFTVVSRFLPRELREDMFHVYAFCRFSDDLGDEEMGQGDRALSLDAWDAEIDRMAAGEPRHPILLPLLETTRRKGIPISLYHDLVAAFRMDQATRRWASFEDLRFYCRHSADPVGRLVLHVFGEAREETFRLSDETCTGLQLANFWQDVRPDLLERDRIYIPLDSLARHALTAADLEGAVRGDGRLPGEKGARFRACLAEEVARARGFFDRGFGLLPLVRRELRIDLELFGRGGVAVLDAIERTGYDVLRARPKLSKARKLWLVVKAFAKMKLGIGA